MLRNKARIFSDIRRFFKVKEYMEVFTLPLVKHPNLDPNVGVFKIESEPLYLHTSPEYPMKKLIARDRKSIYQLAPVFRKDHEDSRHRKSFLMLEWYGVNHSYLNLMEEVEGLVTVLAGEEYGGGPQLDRKRLGTTIDLTPPWLRVRVEDAFRQWAGITFEELRAETATKELLQDKGLSYCPQDSWETRFNMLFVHYVEPRVREIGKPVFLYDYPVEVGLMAASHTKDPSLVQRVELFAGDLELMNGYTELTDPEEQLRRWKEQEKKGEVDQELLELLPQMGLVAGAALGIERLLMLLWEIGDISHVSLSE